MKQKNIAIIGGGGAGAVAAWSLNRVHNITLFETEPVLGGHAYTKKIKVEDNDIFVDLGVDLFSEKYAPNLFALLTHLNIETFVAPLSFGAVYDDQGNHWSNVGIQGKLWERICDECSKFHIQMNTLVHVLYSDPFLPKMSLHEFLKKENYSQEFIYKALLPLLTTFLSRNAPLLDCNLMFIIAIFSKGMMSFFHPTYLRKVKGGINRYLMEITEILKDKIYLDSRILHVERKKTHVSIHLFNKEKYDFDEVIFATHADIALSLIKDPTTTEQEILKGFEYIPIEAILHSDKNLLSSIPELNTQVYYQLNGPTLHPNTLSGSLIKIINSLHKDLPLPLIISFDPQILPSPDLIYEKKEWKIPQIRPKDMLHKKRLKELQGKNRTWFCGTDTNFPGHDSAIVSGLVIADVLGADYPFEHNIWANAYYSMIKSFMGMDKFNKKNFFTKGLHIFNNFLGVKKSTKPPLAQDPYI